jgi:putative tricarboxylic transport membrane protein
MNRAGGGTWAWPEALIGFGLLVFAALVLWSTTRIPVSPLYSKIGPTIFPYITAAGLALFAVLLLIQAARGGWQPDDEKGVAIDWHALGFVAAGLVFNVALIVPLGFILASTGMFVLVAYGFGDRRVVRNAALGFAVALVAYFGFATFLGVNIGAGYFERLLGLGGG